MNESLLHYAWQHKLFDINNLSTTDGHPIEIIDTGQLNRDAGPDFFNAKIRIGETIWAGNVEIHIQASDWYRHQHDKDERYDSVILHVVKESDLQIVRKNGEVIPQIEIKLSEHLLTNIETLNANKGIRCAKLLKKIDADFLSFNMSRWVYQRLYRRCEEIQHLLKSTNNDWANVYQILLFKSFGMHVNALPFELLAKATPLKIIAKHRNSIKSIEAILFGQAGLLKEDINDLYYQQLRNEYQYIKNKYDTKPIEGSLWKYAKMRPLNFPHIRIAQLADLLYRSEHLFAKTIEATNIYHLQELFSCETSEYWQTHYRFGKESKQCKKKMELNSIQLLIINTCIPLLFAYGTQIESEELIERSLHLLEELPPEKNSDIRQWVDLSIKTDSAYQTQGLLELKRMYCETNNCLRCAIGHKLLAKT